jgi:adenylate kinase family enzyme
MSLDRIAVIGISASGKSTFARALAAQTGLPLLHGDQLDWLANWGVRPDDELNVIHQSWIAEPRWIIEGWIDVGRTARLVSADLVIDLDFSAARCAPRVLKRMLVAERRPEMPPGCVDRFSWQTLYWVLWKKERPAIDAALAAAKLKNYVRLRTPRAAAKWLQSLSAR